MIRFSLFLCLMLLAFDAGPASACGPTSLCQVGELSYNVRVPEGWDGATPLPVLLHFHGWGRQGKNVTGNGRITKTGCENSMLLLAPNGLGKSWQFWGEQSEDADFAYKVVADAAKCWPIDRARVYVSGFSYGGSMVWRLACLRGDSYAGYMAISGGLRRQSAMHCMGPVQLAHVHGLDDGVYSLPVGPFEPAESSMKVWRRTNGAAEAPNRRYSWSRYDCRNWDGTHPLTLCTHPRGHYTQGLVGLGAAADDEATLIRLCRPGDRCATAELTLLGRGR